jgi:hypothetical protein
MLHESPGGSPGLPSLRQVTLADPGSAYDALCVEPLASTLAVIVTGATVSLAYSVENVPLEPQPLKTSVITNSAALTRIVVSFYIE